MMRKIGEIIIDFLPGTHITEAAHIMCKMARTYDAQVKTDFNEITLYATPYSKPEEIVKDFERQVYGEERER